MSKNAFLAKSSWSQWVIPLKWSNTVFWVTFYFGNVQNSWKLSLNWIKLHNNSLLLLKIEIKTLIEKDNCNNHIATSRMVEDVEDW